MAPRSGPRCGGAAAKHWGLKPCTQTRKFQVQEEIKQAGLAALQGPGTWEGGQEWVWDSLCAISLLWS